jgi:general secretion pathway protein D
VINLTIRQALSSVSEATGVGSNPIFENQEIETTVIVRDGENVVLGGLIQSNNDQLNTGVPYLNQVPVLGRLFSYQRDNNERRELFIVLRPEIVNINTQNTARYLEILNRFELVADMMEQP